MVESLQKNIQQLKSEMNRYKTRAYKAEEKLGKVKDKCIDALLITNPKCDF